MLKIGQVAMIVSNQHVLFIDPSRQYLTGHRNRKCIKLLLANVQRYVQRQVGHLREADSGLY